MQGAQPPSIAGSAGTQGAPDRLGPGAQCQRRSFRVGSSAMTMETWHEWRSDMLSKIKASSDLLNREMKEAAHPGRPP